MMRRAVTGQIVSAQLVYDDGTACTDVAHQCLVYAYKPGVGYIGGAGCLASHVGNGLWVYVVDVNMVNGSTQNYVAFQFIHPLAIPVAVNIYFSDETYDRIPGTQMDLVNAPNATAVAAIKSGIAGAQMDLVNAPNATAIAAIKSGIAGAQMDLVNAPNATAVAAIKSGIAGAQMDLVNAPNATAVAAIKSGIAGAQMDLVNAPNATAVAAIKSGLATEANVDLVKASTTILVGMTEIHLTYYRYRDTALEMGPSGSQAADWSADEKKQIRHALGVTGTTTAAVGGQLQAAATIITKLDTLMEGDPINEGFWRYTDSALAEAPSGSITGAADWSLDERKQIRDALGVGGDKVTSAGGVLQGLVGQATDLQGRIPPALDSGRMVVSVEAMAVGVLTATAIATGALTSAKFATGAITAGAVDAGVNTAIAAAVLAAEVEDDVTFIQAIQRMGAVVAGKLSGAGSGTEVFVGLDGATTRVTVTADILGNRSAVVCA